MKLTKRQRETLHAKFGGLCAYCGCALGGRWHADHVEPVQRKAIMLNGRYKSTGEFWKPENDTLGNMNPACGPCNIDKATCNLDEWRAKLQRGHEVLERNNATYRHSLRYGVIHHNPEPVIFYFERAALSPSPPEPDGLAGSD
jgi:hypothetical protein